jgi:uncharacterized integral membrane protein
VGILRTIIWVFLTAILVVFSVANWNVVPVRLWPGQDVETKLPMIVIISFLLGFLPMWIALRTTRWSLKRRLDASERQAADLRALANRPVEVTPAAVVNDIPPAPADLFATDKP